MLVLSYNSFPCLFYSEGQNAMIILTQTNLRSMQNTLGANEPQILLLWAPVVKLCSQGIREFSSAHLPCPFVEPGQTNFYPILGLTPTQLLWLDPVLTTSQTGSTLGSEVLLLAWSSSQDMKWHSGREPTKELEPLIPEETGSFQWNRNSCARTQNRTLLFASRNVLKVSVQELGVTERKKIIQTSHQKVTL